jgi:glutaredoxin
MPLRPDLPSGLNLSRRTTTPVKLPRMNFPMIGGVPEAAPGPAEPAHPAQPDTAQGTRYTPEEVHPMMPNQHGSGQPAMPAQAAMPAQSVAPAQTAMATQSAMVAQPAAAAQPAPAPISVGREAARVIIYGRSGCMACLNAIQDLVERQINFVYYDVARDAKAMAHLQTICGSSEAVVPVIVHIGFGGT